MSTNFTPKLYNITASFSNSAWTYGGDISNSNTRISVSTGLSLFLITLSGTGVAFANTPIMWGPSSGTQSSTVPAGFQVITLSSTQICIVNWNSRASGAGDATQNYSIKTNKTPNPPDPTIVNTPVT